MAQYQCDAASFCAFTNHHHNDGTHNEQQYQHKKQVYVTFLPMTIYILRLLLCLRL